MNFPKLDVRIWLLAAAGSAAIAGAVFFRWARRPDDPDEPERRRRARINQIGRIAEGRVLDIMEMPAAESASGGFPRLARAKAAPAGSRKLVCYSYSISGVSYETAQDITSLAQSAGLERLAAGQFASVKYDPVNPSNSIVVADDWSGVH